VAKHHDTRKCIVLLGAILESPELVERLAEVLKPDLGVMGQKSRRKRITQGGTL